MSLIKEYTVNDTHYMIPAVFGDEPVPRVTKILEIAAKPALVFLVL